MDFEKLNTLAAALPDQYKANAQALLTRMTEVIEGIGDNDVKWRPPLLKLVQAVSDRSKLPKGAGAGDIVIGDAKVEQPLGFIPMRMWNARQYWSPDQNEAKILCSSQDAKVGYLGDCNTCPHSKFDEVARKSDCSKIKVVISIKDDLSEIFTTNFAKTNFKIGGEFETLLKKAGVAPYRRIYNMRAETSKQYKNVETYAIDTRSGKERDTPVEVLEFVTELFNMIGVDRKESVDQFHKYIAERSLKTAALEAPAESGVVMIEVSEQTPAESTESSMSKRYDV